MATSRYSDYTAWDRSSVQAAIKLLEEANMEMSKQLEQLRTETKESFTQAGNYDTPAGQVAVRKIDEFIDVDGKNFHNIIAERIANLQKVLELLGQMEEA